MKIVMKTTASGPNGTYQDGKTYDVPEEVGRSFVDGNYAFEVPSASEPETAVAAPQEEATAPPQRRNPTRARERKS